MTLAACTTVDKRIIESNGGIGLCYEEIRGVQREDYCGGGMGEEILGFGERIEGEDWENGGVQGRGEGVEGDRAKGNIIR
ncbi:hypothetical protein SESBI_11522 [Sesbania bispinosa]|nr:hypothetical protein SESBI_11522 [Sesbania bispinosa]